MVQWGIYYYCRRITNKITRVFGCCIFMQGKNATGKAMTLTRGLCLLFRYTNFPALRPSIAHRCRIHLFGGARARRAVEGKDYNTRSFASRKKRQQETSLEGLLNSPLSIGGFLFKLSCSCLVLYVLNVLQTIVFLCSLSCSCV